jgi:Mg-chelatase subunit ChlI
MGVNTVEREGISFAHPARFILVGTMNPEEGELRPQLLDRFALSMDIVGIRDARERVMIMERNIAFERDPEVFRKEWLAKEDELSHQIERARELVDRVTHTSRDLLSIAALTASLNVPGETRRRKVKGLRSLETRIARLPIKAKPPKGGDAEPGI